MGGGISQAKKRGRGRISKKRGRAPSKSPLARISLVLIDHARARNPEIALGPLVVGVCFGWLAIREVRLECLLEPLLIVF